MDIYEYFIKVLTYNFGGRNVMTSAIDYKTMSNCSLFFKVTDSNELWGWLRQEFLPNIYNQAWYNGLKEKEDVYIANKMSILIGMPSMRQLRIKKSKPQYIIFSLCNLALCQR